MCGRDWSSDVCSSDLSGNLFIVTNEIGMGVHAHNQAARDFVELQGWTNQYLAKKAIRVILMVSGIPMQVK